MHKIWPGRRAYLGKYENVNNSDFDGMSLASFCQKGRAAMNKFCACEVCYILL